MFECKCPPKQPKPDIPRERDHRKKKKGKGAKKKKRTPEKRVLSLAFLKKNCAEISI